MIKIAIANQWQSINEFLFRHLIKKAGCNVIWMTDNCKDLFAKFNENPPDLLLLDINLPKSGGVKITKFIKEKYKCHILLTTHDIGSNASQIFEALGYGAMDVVNIQKNSFDTDELALDHFLKKIDTLFLLMDHQSTKKYKKISSSTTDELYEPVSLVVIGASTGGPKALSHLISSFPSNVNFSVIIIQHIDELFIPSLVSWLGDFSNLPVKMALAGTKPQAGVVYVAAKNKNLIINEKNQFEYVDLMKDFIYAPSIDVFFESLVKYWKKPSIAILLTGMGSDGALGLKKLYDKKWYTIVQDQESCIVYGMPKKAITIGAVCDELPLNEIAPTIMRYLTLRSKNN